MTKEELLEIAKLHEVELVELINNNGLLQDVQNLLGLGPIPTRKILTWLGLEEKRLQNSKNHQRNRARINGRKSKYKLSGIPLKPFTDEIINDFILWKNSGLFKCQIMNLLKEKHKYGRKKYNQLCKMFGEPNKNPQSGELNPQYGKSSHQNSGNGISGHLIYNGQKYFFRSLLELRVFKYFIDNNIKFLISNHRIEYVFDGKKRTYNPDLVIENVIYEIKPKKLTNTNINKAKMKALKEYCNKFNLNCQYITEYTFNLPKIDMDWIDWAIKNDVLFFNERNYNRIKVNYNVNVNKRS